MASARLKTRRFLLATLLVVPLTLMGAAWLAYGTVHPCEMYKKDVRASIMGSMLSTASESGAFALLGFALVDKLLDSVFSTMSPVECIEGLVKTKASGEPTLPADVQARLAAMKAKRSTGSSPTAAPDAPKAKPEWVVHESISPVDDSPTVVLRISGDKEIVGSFGESETPMLFLRCRRNRTDAFINFDMQLDTRRSGRRDKEVVATFRYDDYPPAAVTLTPSTDDQAAFSDQPIGMIKALLEHDRLLVEITPWRASPQHTTFDLTGLPDVVNPLREACHW